jgi:hypothetical protein
MEDELNSNALPPDLFAVAFRDQGHQTRHDIHQGGYHWAGQLMITMMIESVMRISERLTGAKIGRSILPTFNI